MPGLLLPISLLLLAFSLLLGVRHNYDDDNYHLCTRKNLNIFNVMVVVTMLVVIVMIVVALVVVVVVVLVKVMM